MFWEGFEKRANMMNRLINPGMRGSAGLMKNKKVLGHTPSKLRLPVPATGMAASKPGVMPSVRVPGAQVPKMPAGTPKTKMSRARGVSSTPI